MSMKTKARYRPTAGMPVRTYRPRDPSTTSRIMAAVRSRDTQCELSLRRALWRRGLRYRLNPRFARGTALVGRPDIVFPSAGVIVFVDGDFWHGRVLREQGLETLRAAFSPTCREWWVGKISSTVARDDRITTLLRDQGWTVIRVWESQVKRNVDSVARRIERILHRR
jgi:DNA mismatch endonuclease (patch repair protein)